MSNQSTPPPSDVGAATSASAAGLHARTAFSPPASKSQKMVWLAIGTVFGFLVASSLPAEPAYAQSVEGGEKFAMCAVPTITATADAVFVLDYLTGRLFGAQYNSTAGRFTARYGRNLVDDFDLAGNEPQFVLLPANLYPRSSGRGPVAVGGIYVGELTTGRVNLYGISMGGAQLSTPNPAVVQLQPIDTFDFRQAAN